MRSKKQNGSPIVLLSQNDQPALLRQRQLARALNVSHRTIDNWKRRKTIPVIRVSCRCVLFHLPSVLVALRRYELKEIGRP